MMRRRVYCVACGYHSGDFVGRECPQCRSSDSLRVEYYPGELVEAVPGDSKQLWLQDEGGVPLEAIPVL